MGEFDMDFEASPAGVRRHNSRLLRQLLRGKDAAARARIKEVFRLGPLGLFHSMVLSAVNSPRFFEFAKAMTAQLEGRVQDGGETRQ